MGDFDLPTSGGFSSARRGLGEAVEDEIDFDCTMNFFCLSLQAESFFQLDYCPMEHRRNPKR
jgi:hypothetical protein